MLCIRLLVASQLCELIWLTIEFLQWLKLTSDDVKEQIYKLAKKGLTPSQIGEFSSEMQCVYAWLLILLVDEVSVNSFHLMPILQPDRLIME